MQIAIASGKGGTGKTTVALSLALALAEEESGQKDILLLDADVEAPNVHLFLNPTMERQEEFAPPIPEVLHRARDAGNVA